MPLKIHTTWSGRLHVDIDELYESSEVTDKILNLRKIPPKDYDLKLSDAIANAPNDDEKRKILERFAKEENG